VTKRAALVKARATLTAQRDATVAKRAKLSAARAKLVAERAKLIKARDGVLQARTKLAAERAELADARKELVQARADIDDARIDVAETVRELTVLDKAVPGAFDQALTDYLAQIDALAPELKQTFQSTLNEGFRDLYLLDGAACLLLLGLLPLIKLPADAP